MTPGAWVIVILAGIAAAAFLIGSVVLGMAAKKGDKILNGGFKSGTEHENGVKPGGQK